MAISDSLKRYWSDRARSEVHRATVAGMAGNLTGRFHVLLPEMSPEQWRLYRKLRYSCRLSRAEALREVSVSK
jgi:hypothetical protein